MSHLGDLGLGALGDLIGTGISSAAQSQLLKKQFEYNKELYQNRYQWTTQDLRKAGLNPILAAGGLSGSAASVGLAGVNSGSVNSAATAYRRMNTVEKKGLEIQQQNADTQESVGKSTVELQGAQALKEGEQKKYYTALQDEVAANIINQHITTAAQAFNLHEQGLAARAGAAARMIEADAAAQNANANWLQAQSAWQNSNTNKDYYGKLGEESAARKDYQTWKTEFEKGQKGWRNKPAFGGQGPNAPTYGEMFDAVDAFVGALTPFKGW